MTARVGDLARSWWWRRFHPLTRVGWATATSGSQGSTARTIIGFGLVGAGLMLGRRGHRRILYRGALDPGANVRIRVYRGDSMIHDGSLRG